MIQGIQSFRCCIRTGVCLKIGNKTLPGLLVAKTGKCLCDLRIDRTVLTNSSGEFTTAACRAEDAATRATRSVSVGAGKSAIQCNLLFFFAVFLF